MSVLVGDGLELLLRVVSKGDCRARFAPRAKPAHAPISETYVVLGVLGMDDVAFGIVTQLARIAVGLANARDTTEQVMAAMLPVTCAPRYPRNSARSDGTARRANVPMRKLHESLLKHFDAIAALGEYHPPTGRIEALNNNWETLVRRGRGYRAFPSLLPLLRFMVVHPIRGSADVERFLALGLVPNPTRASAA